MNESLLWRKSTFSNQGSCVEVAEIGDQTAIRNSNHPHRGMVKFPTMRDFVLACKSGEFDDLA